MKSNKPKRNRFLQFLTSLCSSSSSNNQLCSVDKQKSKNKNMKVTRLTFQFDRVLVKVSRKNVGQQQFMENQILTFHLEKHLANRLKQFDIVVLSGQFSSFLIDKIPFCLILKCNAAQIFDNTCNYIIKNSNKQLKLNQRIIDAYVFQLYYGQNEQQTKQSQNTQVLQQNQQKSNKMEDHINKISQILSTYKNKTNNFIFICHKDLKISDIHDLFLGFKQHYLFQFQRIKKIQKLVCNIIYVSVNARFLKIDTFALSQFFIDKLDQSMAFKQIQKNKTITNINIKNQDKIDKFNGKQASQDKNKKLFQNLLINILDLDLHLQLSLTISKIIDSKQMNTAIVFWLLKIMEEKCPVCKDFIDQYKIFVPIDLSHIENEVKQEISKQFCQFTPVFDIQQANLSPNFTKRTAVFKTNGDSESYDFIEDKMSTEHHY